MGSICRRSSLSLAFFLTLVLSGCDRPAPDGPDGTFAQSLMSQLQAHEFDQLRDHIDPAEQAKAQPYILQKMADLVPAEAPVSVELATFTWVNTPGDKVAHRRVFIEFQYQFEHRWILETVRWREDAAGLKTVEIFNLQPLPASLETLNRFTLAGKTPGHYLFLVMAVALPLYSLAMQAGADLEHRRHPVPPDQLPVLLGQLVPHRAAGAAESGPVLAAVPADLPLVAEIPDPDQLFGPLTRTR